VIAVLATVLGAVVASTGGAIFGEIAPSPNGDTSVLIDIADVQWWQYIGAMLGALGLSPAPWILGLAMGRIQFTTQADKQHARELAQRDEAYEKEVANLKAYHDAVSAAKDTRYSDLEQANEKNIEAAEAQRVRADAATEALSQATRAIEAANHIIGEFTQASKEVSVNGP
jgi:hypothetical protein